jgi:WhiB family redox-sensing transcriptional regulator
MTTTTRLGTKPASDWRNLAACRKVDPDLFFPIGENMAARRQAEEAKAHCRPCPVREKCLEWALKARQDAGVWGGMSEPERRAIHGRYGAGYWAQRPRGIAAQMYDTRRNELVALVEQGLSPKDIAVAMKTNAQTVNRLLERLAADENAKVVASV